MAEGKNPQELPPLEALRHRSSFLDFSQDLQAVLGLGPQFEYRGAIPAESEALTQVTRGRFPVRGFLYSCVLHQVILILLIALPPLVPTKRKQFEFERWIPLDTHLTFNFPRIEPPKKEGGREGGGNPGGKSGGGSPEKGSDSPAPAPKEGGLVYPAPIEAVSNPPNPNNRIQTILQPDLPNPPELKVPVPVPNMVLVKRGAPAPPLLPKIKTPDPVRIEAPQLTIPKDLAKLLPKSMRETPPPPALAPKVKDVPPDKLPDAPQLAMAAQPDMTRLSRKSTAPPPLVPKVSVVASSDTPIEAPKLAVEARAPGSLTYDRGVKAPPPLVPRNVPDGGVIGGTGTVPPPPSLSAQAAVGGGVPGGVPGGIPGGDPRGRGSIPPLVPKVKGDALGAGGTGATPSAPNLGLPPGAGGNDDRNLLVLSPTPGTGGSVPFGEARGQFAMGPNPNLRGVPGLPPGRPDGIDGGTGTGPGDSKGTGKGGGGTGGSGPGGSGAGVGGGGGGTGAGTGPGSGSGVGPGSGTGSGDGTGTGKGSGQNGTGGGGTGSGTGTGPGNGPGQGSGKGSGSGTGSGFGSGSGSGSSPFQGIYIAGVVGGNGGAGDARSGSHQDVPKSPKTSYGMTIVSTSGGGLRDYGIFRNEVVSTVYIEMTHSPDPAPSWTLQYSVLHKDSGVTPDRLIGPFPIDKEKPQLPLEVVARNLGRLVVVYGEINVEGKMVNTRIIQSPNPLLNPPLLEALAKWAFRPAEADGKPVAVKALLGIPLSLPPG